MQRFVAELSNPIEKAAFEKSWHDDPALAGTQPSVEFTFTGKRVSVVVGSDVSTPWPSANFYKSFSAAVRRLDSACNVRWL